MDPALCDTSIPRKSPFGAVLSGMFSELCAESSARAHEQRSTSTLFDRVVAYIERKFDDPELSPASIASALGISLRYLHLLFAQRNQTAGNWIRERRLAYCQEALCSAGSQWSVTEVALRAGFSDPSHFSRVFRRRFGIAPTEFRRRQLDTRAPARA